MKKKITTWIVLSFLCVGSIFVIGQFVPNFFGLITAVSKLTIVIFLLMGWAIVAFLIISAFVCLGYAISKLWVRAINFLENKFYLDNILDSFFANLVLLLILEAIVLLVANIVVPIGLKFFVATIYESAMNWKNAIVLFSSILAFLHFLWVRILGD